MMLTCRTLEFLALACLACFPTCFASGHNGAVKLFPQGETHGTALVPYFTPRSLAKRDQVRVGEAVNDIELPELGQSVELLYGESGYCQILNRKSSF